MITSFNENIVFDATRIKTNVVLETAFSKEIRILLGAGQRMNEHKTAFPIAIHVLSGSLDLGVSGTTHTMKSGDIIALEAHVPHNLHALKDTVVRLTLSKLDGIERIQQLTEK